MNLSDRLIACILILAAFHPGAAQARLSAASDALTPPPSEVHLAHHIYMNQRATAIEVLSATDLNGRAFSLPQNGLLNIPLNSVLEVTDQSEDGHTLRFSLDLERLLQQGQDVSALPNLITTRVESLQSLNLYLLDDGQNTNASVAHESLILPELLAGNTVVAEAPMKYCLRDVRLYAATECQATVVVVERAAIAREAYLNTGKWQPIQRKTWDKFPKCTACFFDGGRQDCSGGASCGHTAIKIGPKSWKGAGVHSAPNIVDKDADYYREKRIPFAFQGCIIPSHLAN